MIAFPCDKENAPKAFIEQYLVKYPECGQTFKVFGVKPDYGARFIEY